MPEGTLPRPPWLHAHSGISMFEPSNHPSPKAAAGFTLVEALVAVSIAALAGSVLLLGVTSSLQNTDEALRQTVALGLAQQLLDEVAGAASVEAIDQYDGFHDEPPADRWGVPLGTEDGHGGTRHPNFHAASGLLDSYGRDVRVHPVDPAHLTTPLDTGQTSDYRVVEIRVTYNAPNRPSRELARIQRVVAYVPSY